MILEVLYQSASVLAVDKPAGIPVVPGREGAQGQSLHERLQAELGERLWVVHRLDRDTSGILVFARTAQAHRTLSMAFEAQQVSKAYLALVEGALEEERTVEQALVPARRGRMRVALPGENGKQALTQLFPEELLGRRATLVRAVPQTGRTHQIRLHLRALGHPLLLDHQYGRKEPFPSKEEPLLTRTPLHSASLRWSGLGGVEDLVLHSPLPSDLERALQWLRQSAARD